MKTALDVHRALLSAGVPHEMLRLRTALLGADDLPRALGVDADACVAVRCYCTTDHEGRSSFAAILMRSGDVPDPVSLLDALEATSVRPATDAETNAVTDFAASMVSPVGLPLDVVLMVDAALGCTDVLYAATGESGVALGIRTRDLLVAIGAKATTLTSRPLATSELPGWDAAGGLARPVRATSSGAVLEPAERSRPA